MRIKALSWLAVVVAAIVCAMLWPARVQAPGRGPTYIFETEHGSFTVMLCEDTCPDSAREFENRAALGYYDGALIARRPGGRLVQLGTGRLTGPAPQCSLTPEPPAHSLPAHALAWALPRAGGKAGYAFFITLEDCPDLTSYTMFASVSGGEDVVNKLRPGDAILSVREQYRRRGRQ